MAIDRTKAPLIKDIECLNPPKVQETKLSSHVPVYSIHADDADIVKMDMIFKAGIWYQEQALIASFTNVMLREGTKNHTSFELSEKLDFYGASITASTEKDHCVVSLYTIKKYFNETLAILQEIIKSPVFPEHELAIMRNNKKNEYLIESQKVSTIASRIFYKNLFGRNHPYSNYYEDSDYDKIESKQLFDFFHRHYNARGCKIIMSGTLENQIFQNIEQCFGNRSWPDSTGLKNKISHAINSNNQKLIFVEKTGSVQSAIRIGNLTINKKHPDFPGLVILNTILGGYFGSRLMSNIREDKGYTYGINSLVYSLLNSGIFVILTEVATKHVKNTIKEVFFEINRLKTDPVPDDELNSVKSYLLGEFIKLFDGPFSSANALKSVIDYGLDFNFYINFIETIKHITPKKIIKLANTYFDESKMLQIVAGQA